MRNVSAVVSARHQLGPKALSRENRRFIARRVTKKNSLQDASSAIRYY